MEAKVDGVALSVLSSAGVPETVFVTDPRSRLVEDLQFTLGEGPCVTAARSRSPVLIEDLRAITAATRQWLAFVHEAESSGICAVFAFPVQVGAIALGTLGLYRARPGPLEPGELRAALRTVDHMASALLDLGLPGGDGVPEAAYRMEVHQAAGMVMVQTDSSIASALARLRATAFSEGVPINDLAADVVAGRRRFFKEEQ
ncbi:GAF domain-containing protein [Nocardioides caricicola]